ncbi:MAG TPA: DUF1800 family protein [Acidimicrobiia bacterium]|nr:DUF1800 family protein [Acidimicrobiia bacterium]
MAGTKERIAHVVRRASMGPHPDVVAELASVDDAKQRVLDLSAPAPVVPLGPPPADYDNPRPTEIVGTIAWWVEQMRAPTRLIEDRLVWFWHDHFATSIAKVRVPYLMAQQHATTRAHATGSFDELLRAMAKDPAMLIYLDGLTNARAQVNENFGRECMELFTMGIGGGYTQRDVVEVSRAFTGWVVNVPGRRFSAQLEALGAGPWTSIFIAARHDDGQKELFGASAAYDLDTAIDAILDQPATGRYVAGKLYRELVGLEPDDATAKRLGKVFSRDWSIMALVEAIIDGEAFTSDAAIRSRARTPVERLVAVLQAGNAPALEVGRGGRVAPVGEALRTMGYIPFVPPNVGGFPKGVGLLGPHQLVHSFDLLSAYPTAPDVPEGAEDLLARFGIHDVSKFTRRALVAERDPGRRFALASACPEMAVV